MVSKSKCISLLISTDPSFICSFSLDLKMNNENTTLSVEQDIAHLTYYWTNAFSFLFLKINDKFERLSKNDRKL